MLMQRSGRNRGYSLPSRAGTLLLSVNSNVNGHVNNIDNNNNTDNDGYDNEERKGNVLFNDALNTFYLRLYGIRHMVKDHTDSKRGNPLLPHGLLFLISSKGCFICTIA